MAPAGVCGGEGGWSWGLKSRQAELAWGFSKCLVPSGVGGGKGEPTQGKRSREHRVLGWQEGSRLAWCAGGPDLEN